MAKLLSLVAAIAGLMISHSTIAATAPLRTLPGVTSLTIEQLLEIGSGDNPPVIIDSRIAADYERGHIEGAISLTDTEMTAEKLAAIVAKDEPVLFYCNGADCKRSANACTKAVQWGWTDVMWYPGGVEWKANDLPLTR
jgi:rhodanese-related sulfurtransferase